MAPVVLDWRLSINKGVYVNHLEAEQAVSAEIVLPNSHDAFKDIRRQDLTLSRLSLKVIGQNISRLDGGNLRGMPVPLLRNIIRYLTEGHWDRPEFAIWWLAVTSLHYDDLDYEEKVRYQWVTAFDLALQGLDNTLCLRTICAARLNPLQGCTLLTTLVLGPSGNIDDTNCNILNHLDHLRFLTIRCCDISDLGIRKLAAGIDMVSDPQQRRGMWSLRAWWIVSCGAITDFGVKAFLRFPSLNILSTSRGQG
jgi:hypothetical protein